MVHRLAPLAACAALLFVCACGGSSRDDAGDVTFDALPLGAFDGYIENTLVPMVVPNDPVNGISVGDVYILWVGEFEVRGFVSFDISALPPPPANVRAATLAIRQFQLRGTPYPTLGSVVIDHVNMGAAFDAADFSSAALDPAFATVTSSGALGYYSVDVRSQIGADQIAGRTRSGFRLRFTNPLGLNTNGVSDAADFNSTEDPEGSGNLPKLSIRYTP